MRSPRLLSEVVRNLLSRPILTSAGLLLAVFAGVTSTWWTTTDAERLQQQWEMQLLSGVFTVRVVDTQGESLSGERCDDLNSIVGVQASGGYLEDEYLTSFGSPSRPVFLQRVTPGYIAVVFPAEPDIQSVGVVVGENLTNDLGLHNGDFLGLLDKGSETQTWLIVERAATTTSRIPGAGGVVFIASAPDSDVNECLVDILPDYFDSVVLAIEGWFDGHHVVVAPFLPGDETRTDPEANLKNRPTKYAGMGAGLVLLAFASAMWWIRRGELSLYRLLGLRYREILLMATAEVFVLLAAPFCAGIAIATIALQSDFVPATLEILPVDLVQAFPFIVVAPWLSILMVWIAKPLQVLREA